MRVLTPEEFEVIVNQRIIKMKHVLGNKAKEYSCNQDRLHNFRVASNMKQESMAKALWGMAVKHLVSIDDIVNNRLDWHDTVLIDEKIGDLVNYLILLEAVIEEWRKNQCHVKKVIKEGKKEQ